MCWVGIKGRERRQGGQVKWSGVKSRLRLPVGWAKTLTATATAGDVTCVADNAPDLIHTRPHRHRLTYTQVTYMNVCMSFSLCKMCPVIETPPSGVSSSAVQSRTEAATQRRCAALWCKVGSADKPQSHQRQQGYAASGGGSIEERLNDYGLSTRRTYGHFLGHSPLCLLIPSSSSSSHHDVASFASPSRHTHMFFVCVCVWMSTYIQIISCRSCWPSAWLVFSRASGTLVFVLALTLVLVPALSHSCLCCHPCSLYSCWALSLNDVFSVASFPIRPHTKQRAPQPPPPTPLTWGVGVLACTRVCICMSASMCVLRFATRRCCSAAASVKRNENWNAVSSAASVAEHWNRTVSGGRIASAATLRRRRSRRRRRPVA